MEELTMTPATVILLIVILACVVLAVHRLVKRGMCDCSDHCEGCGHKSKGAASDASAPSSCACCQAADDMVKKMNDNI